MFKCFIFPDFYRLSFDLFRFKNTKYISGFKETYINKKKPPDLDGSLE